MLLPGGIWREDARALRRSSCKWVRARQLDIRPRPRSRPARCENRSHGRAIPHAPARPRRRGVRRARARAGGAGSCSPLATPSYPAVRERPEEDCGLRTPFQRDRDRIVHSQGVPAPEAQDAGVRRARGRPLPHAAHAHARGDAGLAHGRARAAPQRGPRRGDRARPRPRPPAVRAHRRGRCSTRCLRERFGARFRHYEHSLRVVERSSATARAST